jgi:uncharacterized protein (DUF983 family)
MTNQARYIAAESIISGGRNDACALDATARPAKASPAAATPRCDTGAVNRDFIGNLPPYACCRELHDDTGDDAAHRVIAIIRHAWVD